MRTQALILGVALAGLALVAAAVVSQKRSLQAASERPRAPAPLGRDGSVEESPDPAMIGPASADALASPRDEVAREQTRVTLDEPALVAGLMPYSELLAELQSALERGQLTEQRVAEFLAQLELEWGRPERSLELLERHSSRNLGLWASVARQLEQKGNATGQMQALLAALEIAPGNREFLESLSRVQPELAIAHLSRRLAAEEPPGSSYLRARLAAALLRGGSVAKASGLIEQLLAEDPANDEAIRLLFELDPGRAIAQVEREVSSSLNPGDLRCLLVELLGGSGNLAGAEAALQRFAREGQDVDSSEWGQVAEMWLDAEETERGVAALLRALAVEHGDPDSWVHRLENLAPGELLAALERRVASDERENDEYWGALADSYWVAGRTTEARAAWERARALDRGDDEWLQRLRRLDEGRDPYE